MTRHDSLLKHLRSLAAPILTIAAGSVLLSCQDETPTVGSALASGEVQIALDSLIWNGTEQILHRGEQKTPYKCKKIEYTTVFDDKVDTRSGTNLLGRISVREYGDLHCSFVSRLMCTKTLDIPDSITSKPERIDSMKLILSVPRGALTGDSLAPQQLRAFELTESLPSDINNSFDPSGYYDPTSPLGTRSFTLSALGMSDSIYQKQSYINIQIPMSREMALKTVEAYTNPKTKDTFAWPQTFENYFHGIYVEPSFGRGCIANISFIDFVIYYNYKTATTSTNSEGETTTTVKTNVGAAGVFASSPIVLSSNNIKYTPSDYLTSRAEANEAIITSPGGYRVSLSFPGQDLVDIYQQSDSKLAVVSDLKFSIPVEEIKNDFDITPPPYLIMVKTSKLDDFLSNNSLPDNKDSFYAEYSASAKRYTFSSMRNYILGLIKKNTVEKEDVEFTIIPANLEFESQQSSNSYYSLYGYSSSSSGVQYPIKCTPYIAKPSMCRLKMDEARTIFTYSIQQLK